MKMNFHKMNFDVAGEEEAASLCYGQTPSNTEVLACTGSPFTFNAA